ncbi:glycoside hydrolase family 19 protein [Collimonas fungivorans]|uniref:glycoside hydrolase family 19 protein n=1 Tax=Collimonas fungivorans TaxID=158899 RepID=UPI003FA3BFDB
MTNSTAEPLGETTADTDHTKVEQVTVACACNRDITIDELKEAYPDRKKTILEKFLPELNATMKSYDITSCLRKAHFLAQAGHESSELFYTAENVSAEIEKKNYGGYKGRGLIQITGKGNYTAYGTYIKQDLLGENRLKVEETKLATDSAGWFWLTGRSESLNIYADQNDLLYISAEINGGYNGYEGQSTSRLRLLKNAVDSLHVVACPQLDALFTAFPEVAKFTYETFKLENSKAYDKLDMAFAWGYWHDPKSTMHGTKKDVELAKLGYSRYVELYDGLTEAQIKKLPDKRFGIERKKMKPHAENRLKELALTTTEKTPK